MNIKKILLIIFIIISILACIFIYLTNKPFFVAGESMMPNYKNGDLLIIDRYSMPERGDAIVFYFSDNPGIYYLKRVVGLPNETIEVSNNSILLINKEESVKTQLRETYPRLGLTETKMYNCFKLSADEYYVLGDNRENSSDSRHWGPVKKALIIGKVLIRV